MEEQLKKLKTKTIITIILALLALTWQFLNYLTIKKYIPFDEFANMELVIVISGYVFFVILFFSLISLSFTVFRVSLKFRSEKKKIEKEKKAEEKHIIQNDNDNLKS
ncbi:MAG: hypothetical protein H6612_11870 [Ignavibacteriales bacterium]|nr:hypothetical protein [Ignavibacteriales bacterium]MCB9260037.1 hypothetical protein [Ignavibacteriales bacterium]